MPVKRNRKRVATSHGGAYTYWTDPDGYVYQRDALGWVGWICSLATWEKVFSKAPWISLEVRNA